MPVRLAVLHDPLASGVARNVRADLPSTKKTAPPSGLAAANAPSLIWLDSPPTVWVRRQKIHHWTSLPVAALAVSNAPPPPQLSPDSPCADTWGTLRAIFRCVRTQADLSLGFRLSLRF